MDFTGIRKARKKAGITQDGLASLLGINRATVSKYESGQIEPSLSQLGKIAKTLGTTVSEMMGPDWDGWSRLDTSDAFSTEKAPTPEGERKPLPKDIETIDFSKYHKIPILGRISAGLPLYADEHIEGYTITDLNGGAEYFGLRIHGDIMNALRINEGDIIIVRRQEDVEQGEIAVVLVDEEDATVKRFYSSDTTVTLMPQSTNPKHKPQIYDLNRTAIRVLGKVVKVEFTL